MNLDTARILLTGASLAGVAGTGFFAAQDSRKALKELTKLGMEDAPMNERVKVVWKCYWRTLVAGGVTGGVIVASHKINTKHILAIAGIATTGQRLYSRYEDKIKELISSVKNQQIKDEVVKEISLESAKEKLALVQKEEDEELFYEPITDQFFSTTIDRFNATRYDINHLLHSERSVRLNTFLDLVGAKRVDWGDDWGWWLENDFWSFNWSFFGAPWIEIGYTKMMVDENTEYNIITYYPLNPDAEYSDEGEPPFKQNERYQKELEEAKDRWFGKERKK